ncbi:aspartate-semialdehyde dehydrogenase [Cenarchaeum symbiosum A]|uniref:aspartate-semialdehyde dehydrogenase n=1 Tax=Cenarchaeum symbiosum (strain A) TaxID=414004 RepID=A0RZ30_CENSY|nr:aspartate-semialdehyde dehydrogenase [Cenarchaeum symbiosum A]
MEKKRVAILGATGAVGQEFVQSLEDHPWFTVTQIAASERSAGKKYIDAIRDDSGIVGWEIGGEIPPYITDMMVKSIDQVDVSQLDLVFSAIESGAARDIETKFAADLPVISTSSAYRYEEDVPILIPGINDEQADLLDTQKKNRNWKGWVAPLPNCTTTGLAITLKPIYEKYGAKKVRMTSMQAISGGGRSPGVSAMNITDNIIPYIPKEEEKVRIETRKILGKLKDGKIIDADIKVSATCTRVPILDGHTESVAVETEDEIDPAKAKALFDESNRNSSVAGLPSAPDEYYAFHEDPTRPQPRLERPVGDGMTTTIGRVEKEDLFDNGLKYMLFSHNKKMGSGKGAVLLAEMLLKKGKI